MNYSVVCGVALVASAAACGDDQSDIWPDAFWIDASPACPPPKEPRTPTMKSASITAPETWTADESPHLIVADTSITAAVTIEKCAEVRIAAGRQVSIRAGGSITANGEPYMPVTIEGLSSQKWRSIRTLDGGTLSLTHTVVSGGGAPLEADPWFSAMLDIAGTTPATEPILHANNLVISDSASCGIALHDGGGFTPSSSDVIVLDSLAPITTWARAMGTIPTGRYDDNTLNEIVVWSTGGPEAVVEDVTIHDRGVPYRVGTQPELSLDVAAVDGLATLTIEPGVVLRFAPGGRLRIDPASGTAPARGALVATGQEGLLVTFTTASSPPVAGDWYGIWFGGTPAPSTKMDFVRVAYAGKASASSSDSCVPPGQTGPNDAAIRVFGEPSAAFITNAWIQHSALHGIDRGFRSDTKPTFRPTNVFTNIAGCTETYPPDVNGTCPSPLPCN